MLACGALYGVTYVIANGIVAANRYGTYSRSSQERRGMAERNQPFLLSSSGNRNGGVDGTRTRGLRRDRPAL